MMAGPDPELMIYLDRLVCPQLLSPGKTLIMVLTVGGAWWESSLGDLRCTLVPTR